MNGRPLRRRFRGAVKRSSFCNFAARCAFVAFKDALNRDEARRVFFREIMCSILWASLASVVVQGVRNVLFFEACAFSGRLVQVIDRGRISCKVSIIHLCVRFGDCHIADVVYRSMFRINN